VLRARFFKEGATRPVLALHAERAALEVRRVDAAAALTATSRGLVLIDPSSSTIRAAAGDFGPLLPKGASPRAAPSEHDDGLRWSATRAWTTTTTASGGGGDTSEASRLPLEDATVRACADALEQAWSPTHAEDIRRAFS